MVWIRIPRISLGIVILRGTLIRLPNPRDSPKPWVEMASLEKLGIIHVIFTRTGFASAPLPQGMSKWFLRKRPVSNVHRSEWSMRVPILQERWNMMSAFGQPVDAMGNISNDECGFPWFPQKGGSLAWLLWRLFERSFVFLFYVPSFREMPCFPLGRVASIWSSWG